MNHEDRLSNEKLLEITEQSSMDNIMRGNKLRYLGHVSRVSNNDNGALLIKKSMFSYFNDRNTLTIWALGISG